jgi:hypothetical protein
LKELYQRSRRLHSKDRQRTEVDVTMAIGFDYLCFSQLIDAIASLMIRVHGQGANLIARQILVVQKGRS